MGSNCCTVIPRPSTAEERNLASENYFRGVCYTETYFREPESQADQTRLLSIVDTDGGGYYGHIPKPEA